MQSHHYVSYKALLDIDKLHDHSNLTLMVLKIDSNIITTFCTHSITLVNNFKDFLPFLCLFIIGFGYTETEKMKLINFVSHGRFDADTAHKIMRRSMRI